VIYTDETICLRISPLLVRVIMLTLNILVLLLLAYPVRFLRRILKEISSQKKKMKTGEKTPNKITFAKHCLNSQSINSWLTLTGKHNTGGCKRV